MNFIKAAFNFTETQNGALTLESSGEHLVNLYFNYVRNSDKLLFHEELTKSWNEEEKIYVLKYIAHIRDINEGKGERQLFIDALSWLYKTSRENFIYNLHNYVSIFGRWRDIVTLYNLTKEEKILEIVRFQLEKDMENLRNKKSISLLPKWIPSEGKKDFYPFSYDLIKVLKISKQQFRKMISELRKTYELVETKLCQNRNDEINYSHVPSVCMHIHGKSGNVFPKKDYERFEEWKKSLKQQNTTEKINTKALFPYQIVQRLLVDSPDSEVKEFCDLQWSSYVKNIKEDFRSRLSRCLVMSDVSGSMYYGNPRYIDASISLGILISSLIPEKSCFKDLVMTFSDDPEFVNLSSKETLSQKIDYLSKSSWGMNTDFNKAFSKILQTGVVNKLSNDLMPDTLIVLSDMEFDKASDKNKTNFEQLKIEYNEAGYQLPRLIFWNLSFSRNGNYSTSSSENNVKLVSGYSDKILEKVLSSENLTPADTIRSILDNERYNIIEYIK